MSDCPDDLRVILAAELDGDDTLKAKVQNGDGEALIAALVVACTARTVQPDWLAIALLAALRRFTRNDSRTLDEAFRVSRPKGYHVESQRLTLVEGLKIWRACTDLHRAGAAIDDALFEAVGEMFAVGKTTAKKWYYQHRKRSRAPDETISIDPGCLGPDLRLVLETLRPASAKTEISRKDHS